MGAGAGCGAQALWWERQTSQPTWLITTVHFSIIQQYLFITEQLENTDGKYKKTLVILPHGDNTVYIFVIYTKSSV